MTLLRSLTGGARWDEATGWPDQYAPPKPGNGIGGDPCPCERPHGPLYSDGACDAAYARAALVRRHAIATSEERPTWLEQATTPAAVAAAAAWIRERFDRMRAAFVSDPGGYLAYVDAPMDDPTAAAAIDIIEAEWAGARDE